MVSRSCTSYSNSRSRISSTELIGSCLSFRSKTELYDLDYGNGGANDDHGNNWNFTEFMDKHGNVIDQTFDCDNK